MARADSSTPLVPAVAWLRAYDRSWLKADVVAGLTTAAIVLPKAMAYATIADLPLVVGLYTAFLPMVVYAVLGTSRLLSMSTTTTIAILGAAALGQLTRAHPGLDPVTATATLGAEAASAIATLESGKRPEFPVEIEMSTGEGDDRLVTGSMTVTWTLKLIRR
jgi:MFS superfamily sulfate permease-like transporter